MIVNVQTGAKIYNTETKTDNFTYKENYIELKQEDAKNLLDIKPEKNENKKTTYVINPNDLSKVTVINRTKIYETNVKIDDVIKRNWLTEIAETAKNINYYINKPVDKLYTGPSLEIHTVDENDNGTKTAVQINYYKTNIKGLYKTVYSNSEATDIQYTWLKANDPILKLKDNIIVTDNAYGDYRANYISQLQSK